MPTWSSRPGGGPLFTRACLATTAISTGDWPGWAGRPPMSVAWACAPGRAALHVAWRGALFVGDAFATYAVTTGARGPQVAPFTADAAQAVKSLTRLEAISADYVLPGHGDPWTGGVQEAVQQIRQAQDRSG